MTVSWQILEGDARERLRELPERSVQTCVTSPPYFGLRDYGTGEWAGGDAACDHIAGMARQDTQRETPGGRGGSFRGGEVQFRDACGKCGATRTDHQLGLEATPDEYVTALVDVFREVRRVLRDDGTVWLNLGDSYSGAANSGGPQVGRMTRGSDRHGPSFRLAGLPSKGGDGIKPKDLLGIPWMVAFALRADGWYLRSDIIWNKPNPMPESVTDRPTKSHEYVFLLSKGPRYFYDADSIREQADSAEDYARRTDPGSTGRGQQSWTNGSGTAQQDHTSWIGGDGAGRNKRSVWTVATRPYPGAHFATFPPKLIEPCILAGAPEGATVLDPFAGAGTTGLVALRHNRSFIGIELNPEYADLARWRIRDDSPLLNAHAEILANDAPLR